MTTHTTEGGAMKINITRKSGNVRTGSRAWAAQYTKHPVNSSDMRYAVQELCVAALKSAGVEA